MALPNIEDYPRIHPPWASVVVGRTPVVKWHATRGGAKVSAQANSIGYATAALADRQRIITTDHGIAVLQPDGTLLITESWTKGTKVDSWGIPIDSKDN